MRSKYVRWLWCVVSVGPDRLLYHYSLGSSELSGEKHDRLLAIDLLYRAFLSLSHSFSLTLTRSLSLSPPPTNPHSEGQNVNTLQLTLLPVASSGRGSERPTYCRLFLYDQRWNEGVKRKYHLPVVWTGSFSVRRSVFALLGTHSAKQDRARPSPAVLISEGKVNVTSCSDGDWWHEKMLDIKSPENVRYCIKTNWCAGRSFCSWYVGL